MADVFALPRAARGALARLVPVVCPPDVTVLGLVDDVVAHATLTIGSFPAPMRSGLLAGVTAFELSRGLTLASTEAAFARWWALPGPFHAFAKGVKAILVMGYYEHPRVQDELGYDALGYVAEAVARRHRAFPDDIARFEEMLVAPSPLVTLRRSPGPGGHS